MPGTGRPGRRAWLRARRGPPGLWLAPVLLALAAAAPLPGVGLSDGRQAVSSAAAPWSALARLQVPGMARCTAVMVAPRIALTAGHCLWSDRLLRWVRPDTVYVLAGYERGRFTGLARAQTYRIAPGNDVAEIILDRPLANPVLGFAWAPPPGTPAMLGGYNQDRNEIIEADTRCRILSDNGLLVRHDCEGTHGTSGAPLLVRGSDGIWQIGGIQTAAFVGQRGGIAVAMASLRRWLYPQEAPP